MSCRHSFHQKYCLILMRSYGRHRCWRYRRCRDCKHRYRITVESSRACRDRASQKKVPEPGSADHRLSRRRMAHSSATFHPRQAQHTRQTTEGREKTATQGPAKTLYSLLTIYRSSIYSLFCIIIETQALSIAQKESLSLKKKKFSIRVKIEISLRFGFFLLRFDTG